MRDDVSEENLTKVTVDSSSVQTLNDLNENQVPTRWFLEVTSYNSMLHMKTRKDELSILFLALFRNCAKIIRT